MNGTYIDLSHKVKDLDSKFCKYIDIVYRCGLIMYVAYLAMCLTAQSVLVIMNIMQMSGIVLLTVAGLYKAIIEFFKNLKIAFLALGLIAFSVVVYFVLPYFDSFPVIVLAMIGAIGISADQILIVGIISNVIMIFNNILMTLFSGSNFLQARDFFYLGNNTFYVSKINNFSSTALAAHYFWIITAYLWVRGKKISWGEIFALGAFDFVIYSLTGSNTSFLCIGLTLIIAFIYKVKAGLTKALKYESAKDSVISSILNFIKRLGVFCFRYSFVIFAVVFVVLMLVFNNQVGILNTINNLTHGRIGLSYRGYIEYGIHLFAQFVPSYGINSSLYGFYNFLDCSYVNILIRYGVILFVFYVGSMSIIQYRHKKYIYGVCLLAVCALSCIEEHHLIELPYNFFVLLLFADLEVDRKNSDLVVSKKKTDILIKSVPWVICLVLFIATVLINMPRYNRIKNLDRLDERADELYVSLQNHLDLLMESGEWSRTVNSMNSIEFGDVLDSPDDYQTVTGFYWSDAVKDPKVHSYFAVTYDAVNYNTQCEILDVLLTDEIKNMVGEGSLVIEYDVVAGKIYSVWYSEESGCSIIPGGRNKDRAERLSDECFILEGYSTGD